MGEGEKNVGGRRSRQEQALTDEQRAALGRDRFFDLEEIATILGVAENNVRQAAQRGKFPVYLAQGERRRQVQKANGLDIIRWRDKLAGLGEET